MALDVAPYCEVILKIFDPYYKSKISDALELCLSEEQDIHHGYAASKSLRMSASKVNITKWMASTPSIQSNKLLRFLLTVNYTTATEYRNIKCNSKILTDNIEVLCREDYDISLSQQIGQFNTFVIKTKKDTDSILRLLYSRYKLMEAENITDSAKDFGVAFSYASYQLQNDRKHSRNPELNHVLISSQSFINKIKSINFINQPQPQSISLKENVRKKKRKRDNDRQSPDHQRHRIFK